MATVTATADQLGISAACDALSVSRATFYRWRWPRHGPKPRRSSHRALSTDERAVALAVLHEDRFVDQAPGEVYATLLDEGTYLCSERTMYRILADNEEVRERRNQLRHPAYAKPELLATAPNSLWSWDITKLPGPKKWSYFHLYVIIDVFSRYVVGWMVAHRESAALAEKLIEETYERQQVTPGTLTIHADRGSSMKSKVVAHLLADLGVTRTHSRPRVSNDNPYSEAHFKTLKYRPSFPARFGSLEDARAHIGPFMDWYNDDHHHSGIGLLTPSDLHHGRAADRLQARHVTLSAAQQTHPERFVSGPPALQNPPTAVWINKPTNSVCSLAASASELTESPGVRGEQPPGSEEKGSQNAH